MNWLQVVFSSSPQNMNTVSNDTPCLNDAPPASVLNHPSPPIPLMLVQAKDQNFTLLVALRAALWCCAKLGGSNWPGIFRVGWKARTNSCKLQSLLWYNMML